MDLFTTAEEWTVSGTCIYEYAFAYGGGEDYSDGRVDFVVGQTPGRTLTRVYYKFTEEPSKRFVAEQTFNKYTEITKDFVMTKEAIGIGYGLSKMKKSFGFIVLMRDMTDNQVVYWCWRHINVTEVRPMTFPHRIITFVHSKPVSVRTQTTEKLYNKLDRPNNIRTSFTR